MRNKTSAEKLKNLSRKKQSSSHINALSKYVLRPAKTCHFKLSLSGWPEDKLESPLCVREYWPYRDELATQNGLVFRGRDDNSTHRSHLGIQHTISIVRDIMYWPGSDLKEAVQRCETCQQSKPALPKEPLMTYPIPSLPL